jgi:hypothetical protein
MLPSASNHAVSFDEGDQLSVLPRPRQGLTVQQLQEEEKANGVATAVRKQELRSRLATVERNDGNSGK